MYLKYSGTKKRAKNVQKRVKTCKNMQKRASQVLIYQKNMQKRAMMCKNVHLKYFWTQFKNVHLRGSCILRLCILRPYCISVFTRNNNFCWVCWRLAKQFAFFRPTIEEILYRTDTSIVVVALVLLSTPALFASKKVCKYVVEGHINIE